MKVGQLEPSFNNTEWICQKSTGKTRHRGSNEILGRRLFRFLEVLQARKVDVAASAGLHAGCHQSFIVALDSILLIDVLARGRNVVEDTTLRVQFLESMWREHQGHLYVLEGLQQHRRHHSTRQSINSLLVNHNLINVNPKEHQFDQARAGKILILVFFYGLQGQLILYYHERKEISIPCSTFFEKLSPERTPKI